VGVDGAGNIYIAGLSNSMDLPVTKGAYQTGYAGGTGSVLSGDAFIAKYSPTGALVYLTYLGGQKDDVATALAVDAAGNAYVTGYTNSTDFPVTANALQTKFGGYVGGATVFTQGDAFVSKLSPDGKTLVYSTYLGGDADDAGFGIAVDSTGNAYVTGTTSSRRFPVSANAFQAVYGGSGGQSFFPKWGYPIYGGDAFIAKLNPAGSQLVYCDYLGGSYDDIGTSIAVDSSGNAYLGGYTLSPDFPHTMGALRSSFAGIEPQNFFFNFGDGFLAKVSPDGSKLIYSTYLGGSGDDWVSSITVDSTGAVYAAGVTTSVDFPTSVGSFQKAYKGPVTLPFLVDQLLGDAFLVKLNPAGSGLVFATYLGGSGDDVAMAMAQDGAGNLIVVGFTDSPDFPVTTGAIQKTNQGPGILSNNNSLGDVFLAQFSPTGVEAFATYLGGTLADAALGVAVTSSGVAYVTGITVSSNFPALSAAQPKLTATSSGSAFLSAISGLGSQATNGLAISSVVSDTGGGPVISQNTWVEIFGKGLATSTRTWQGPDFVSGQLPTQLDGVSVTVNGKPAFVEYISPTQVNILTPLDPTTGTVQVVLTNGSNSSSPFAVQAQQYAPGFFQFGAGPYVAATHADNTYLGPASLYPGLTTPAKPGETVVLYLNGFGQTTPPLVNGAEFPTGTINVVPTVRVGGLIANVIFAGIVSAGEYQFNVVLPASLPDGDASISVSFNGTNGGFVTQPGALITIKN
jgi:uncharacterized protein (TIGR03437 family)